MQHKKCTKCGEEKPATLEYFHRKTKTKDGLQYSCKQCNKAYNEANKEHIKEYYKEYYKEYGKAYYEANKESIKEYKKAYNEANKEHKKEYSKAYNEANKEHKKEYSKAYYEANKESLKEYSKAHNRTPKGKYTKIKRGAKVREINFAVPFQIYESKLWGEPCHYCGVDIEVTGLDRKDSNKGYTPDNVVPCCYDCNRKKSTKPYEQFLEEIKKNTCIS
jgi:hypothetical protein